MTTVEEIKEAIERLSLSERGELERLLHGWRDDAWDAQIKRDAQDGKLDGLLRQVDADIDAGELQDMP